MDDALHIVIIDPIGFLYDFPVNCLLDSAPAGRQFPRRWHMPDELRLSGKSNASSHPRKEASKATPRAYVHVASRGVRHCPLTTNS